MFVHVKETCCVLKVVLHFDITRLNYDIQLTSFVICDWICESRA